MEFERYKYPKNSVIEGITLGILTFPNGLFSIVLTYVMAICMFVALLNIFTEGHKCPELFYVIVLIFGYIMGYIAYLLEFVEAFSTVLNFTHSHIFYIFFPILLFSTSFGVDFINFKHNLRQIVVVSVLGYILYIATFTLATFTILGWSIGWPLLLTVMFCSALSVIRFENVLNEVQNAPVEFTMIHLTLQSEQLVYTVFSMFVYLWFFHHTIEEMFELDDLALLELIATPLAGLVSGILINLIYDSFFFYVVDNLWLFVVLTFFTAYISFYLGYLLLESGCVFLTAAVGVLFSGTKIRAREDLEQEINGFWDTLYRICSTIVFFIAGLTLGVETFILDLIDLIIIFVVYLLIFSVRSVVFFLMCGLSRKHFKRPLEWKTTATATWSGYLEGGSIIIAMLIRSDYPQYGQQVLAYIAVISAVSTLISSSFLYKVFEVAGIYTVTRKTIDDFLPILKDCRERALQGLRIEFMSKLYANWAIIEHVTSIENFFRDLLKWRGDYTNEGIDMTTIAMCPDCGREPPPTRDEIYRTKKTLKQKVVEDQKTSYWNQYDTGAISKSTIKIMCHAIEKTIDDEDPLRYIDKVRRYWKFPIYLLKIRTLLEYLRKHMPVPLHFRTYLKYEWIWYCYINRKKNKLLFTFLCLIDIIVNTFIIINHNQPNTEMYTRYIANICQAITILLYFVFAFEVLSQMHLLGSRYYLTKHVHKVEALICIMIRTYEIVFYFHSCIIHLAFFDILIAPTVIIHLKKAIYIRIVKLYFFIEVMLPNFLRMTEKHLELALMQGFEIGIAYLVAHKWSSLALPICTESTQELYVSVKKQMDIYRAFVARELGMIEKFRPLIALTVKTRYAINIVIDTYEESLIDMFRDGLLDEKEMNIFQSIFDQLRKSIKFVCIEQPHTSEDIVRNLNWIKHDQELASYLLTYSRIVYFQPGEVIISDDYEPCGLYILLSGMVKVKYAPSQSALQELETFGALPNSDIFFDLMFKEAKTDFVTAGGTIGELGALTLRRYDMEVICETPIEAYFVPWLSVYSIIEPSEISDIISKRIWQSVGTKIALNILPAEPQYKGWEQKKVLMHLSNAFVMDLEGLETLELHNFEDVVLIEGLVKDKETDRIYYAPSYIPRKVNSIVFPNTDLWSFYTLYETRLLFVPKKEEDNDSDMEIDFQIDEPVKKVKIKKIKLPPAENTEFRKSLARVLSEAANELDEDKAKGEERISSELTQEISKLVARLDEDDLKFDPKRNLKPGQHLSELTIRRISKRSSSGKDPTIKIDNDIDSAEGDPGIMSESLRNFPENMSEDTDISRASGDFFDMENVWKSKEFKTFLASQDVKHVALHDLLEMINQEGSYTSSLDASQNKIFNRSMITEALEEDDDGSEEESVLSYSFSLT